MFKKKEAKMNETNVENTEETVNAAQETPRDRFISDEKLQAFYNDAYINERDRLNAMFGRIDSAYPIVEEKIVYRDPDLSEYVHVSKYKKKSVAAAVLGVLFGIAAIAAGVLAYLHFFA